MRVIKEMLSDIESKTFDIGFVGEKNHTCVMINCVSLFNQYPDAAATMVAKPPVGDIYPVVLHRDGVFVVWNVSESDIANAGSGQYQLTFTDGEGDNAEIIKTVYGSFSVKPSIVSNGEPPEPIEDWLEEANEALAEFGKINELSASATTLATGSEATAEITTVSGHKNIAIGIPKGDKGDKGDQGDPAPSDQVIPAVNSYLAQVITNPDSPPLDRNLSSNVSAAPADMVGDLKSAIEQDVVSKNNIVPFPYKDPAVLSLGVQFTPDHRSIHIVGTPTGMATFQIFGTWGANNNIQNTQFVPGKTYFILKKDPLFKIVFFNSSGTALRFISASVNSFTVPVGSTGANLYYQFTGAGSYVNYYFMPFIIDESTYRKQIESEYDCAVPVRTEYNGWHIEETYFTGRKKITDIDYDTIVERLYESDGTTLKATRTTSIIGEVLSTELVPAT